MFWPYHVDQPVAAVVTWALFVFLTGLLFGFGWRVANLHLPRKV